MRKTEEQFAREIARLNLWAIFLLAIAGVLAMTVLSQSRANTLLQAEKTELEQQVKDLKLQPVAPIYIVPIRQTTPVRLERMSYVITTSKGFQTTEVLACGRILYDGIGKNGRGKTIFVVDSQGVILGTVAEESR